MREAYEGINLNQTFGFPAYMDQQLPIIHGGPGTSVPAISVSGYTGVNGLHILSMEDDYLLTPNLSWVKGKHTFKFGADWRDMRTATTRPSTAARSVSITCSLPRTLSIPAPPATVWLRCCLGWAPAAARRPSRKCGTLWVQSGVPGGDLQPVQPGLVRTSGYGHNHIGEPDHGIHYYLGESAETDSACDAVSVLRSILPSGSSRLLPTRGLGGRLFV